MPTADSLLRLTPQEYGETYRVHLLEQYKLFVELTDRVAVRRQNANGFFVSVNTAILAFVGLTARNAAPLAPALLLAAVSGAGLLICFAWYRIVRSYRDLSTARFEIIHALEERLPAALFTAEWVALGHGKDRKKYLRFTEIEMWIPWAFLSVHAIVCLWALVESWVGQQPA